MYRASLTIQLLYAIVFQDEAEKNLGGQDRRKRLIRYLHALQSSSQFNCLRADRYRMDKKARDKFLECVCVCERVWGGLSYSIHIKLKTGSKLFFFFKCRQLGYVFRERTRVQVCKQCRCALQLDIQLAIGDRAFIVETITAQQLTYFWTKALVLISNNPIFPGTIAPGNSRHNNDKTICTVDTFPLKAQNIICV